MQRSECCLHHMGRWYPRGQEVSCVALQCQAPCLPAASSLQEPLLASRVLGVKKDLFENVCKWRWG